MALKTLSFSDRGFRRVAGPSLSLLGVAAVFAAAGCERSKTKVELQQQVEQLRIENEQLKREAESRLADIERLLDQVANLQAFQDRRGADIFASQKLEILSLSRGANYDDHPGDDGVTVHFRPLDEEGNVVTVGGQVAIQLVDNSVMGSPRVVGLLRLSSPDELRTAWHSRFLTNHYTVKCPFSAEAASPTTRHLDVDIEFIDYLSGRTLRAQRTVEINPPQSSQDSEATITSPHSSAESEQN